MQKIFRFSELGKFVAPRVPLVGSLTSGVSATVALTWQRVEADWATSAYDRWGPRARVAKWKKRGFNPRVGGIEPGTWAVRAGEQSHWASARFVLDLRGGGILRRTGAVN